MRCCHHRGADKGKTSDRGNGGAMMRIILFFVIGISIPWHSLMAASLDWRQNTQTLPPYCKDRVKGINSAEFKRWKSTLGDAFIHAHHYCSAIFAEQKARSTVNQQERQRWLRTVLGEMQYVSNHCPARCALYPELHSRWGWAACRGHQALSVGNPGKTKICAGLCKTV